MSQRLHGERPPPLLPIDEGKHALDRHRHGSHGGPPPLLRIAPQPVDIADLHEAQRRVEPDESHAADDQDHDDARAISLSGP